MDHWRTLVCVGLLEQPLSELMYDSRQICKGSRPKSDITFRSFKKMVLKDEWNLTMGDGKGYIARKIKELE